MYEQYTDKQIVEMLVPKLNKSVPEVNWRTELFYNDSLVKALSNVYRSAYIRGQLGRSFIIGENKDKKSVSLFKTGDKVKFIGFNFEYDSLKFLVGSQLYPPVNTIGEVVEVLSPEFCFVQWPKGAVYSNGALSCPNCFLEKVTEYWVPATKDNVKVDSKVRMIDEDCHNNYPRWFPIVGTVGIVKKLNSSNCNVQWPYGTTSRDDKWDCKYKRLDVLLCE